MELANEFALLKAGRKHPQTVGWLSDWSEMVKASSWRSIVDVRAIYPHADPIPLRKRGKVMMIVTCFNVGGNDFRLLTTINYQAQRVNVIDVLTHAEYNKDHWKKRLS